MINIHELVGPVMAPGTAYGVAVTVKDRAEDAKQLLEARTDIDEVT